MSDSQALANKLADAELDIEQGRRAQGLRKLREVRDELRTAPSERKTITIRPPDNGYLPPEFPVWPRPSRPWTEPRPGKWDPVRPSSAASCGVCGLVWGSGPMGYVCNHSQCPTRVTC